MELEFIEHHPPSVKEQAKYKKVQLMKLLEELLGDRLKSEVHPFGRLPTACTLRIAEREAFKQDGGIERPRRRQMER